ncbi:MAG TPA: AlkA N-terminal domain-containing protein [Anaeromyxobacteraceae bacterium]|nr:AlkA N-terminal domain-containing protein [Anaeromyxobacteraceae bacterium]
MELDPVTCHRALAARDRRFDGLFFVGVSTTGVYCRPVCPARTPRREHCSFFRRAAEAEGRGYRACLRCRPELAPGAGPLESGPRLAASALARIEAGFLNEGSVDELAASLGVSARHLRRAVVETLGVTPVELAQTRRLGLAKQLLHDTRLSLAEVALASGFESVRRFNALFRTRFGRPPSELRREVGRSDAARDAVELRLDYRPRFDWPALLAFLEARATPGVEEVADGVYRRTVRHGGRTGWVSVAHDARRPALLARVAPSLSGALMPLAARLRAAFDLDARPEAVAAHLERDPLLRRSVRRRPGLRLPGAFDGFEAAARAVVGQHVSVRAATTVAGRLAAALGDPIETPFPGLDRLFPAAAVVGAAGEGAIAKLGMPGARARALGALANAVHTGALSLETPADAARAREALTALPGIGPWTADVIAMRALAQPDAFPAADLGIARALGARSPREAEERAEPWRPWRAYAAMHLWTTLAEGGSR